MQNKANLLDSQMNVSHVLTKDYENVRLHRRGKNKPNQTQFHPEVPSGTQPGTPPDTQPLQNWRGL
jgi:hypothetical protein